MNTLLSLLENIPEYNETKKALLAKKSPVSVTGTADSEKCHFVAGMAGAFNNTLFVTYNDLRAREVYEDMRLFRDNVYWYPAKDLIFYNADVHSNAIVKSRMQAIKAVSEGNALVVVSFDALLDKILPIGDVSKNIIHLKTGEEMTEQELSEHLVALGYDRQDQVSEPGEFAVRGGVFDIFTLNDEAPVRLEFFGDEIDTIKSFDVDSQRSIQTLDEFVIFPATEFILTDDEMNAGFERIKKEEKQREEQLRKDIKNEEAHRLKTICEEMIETLEYSRGSACIDTYVNSFYPGRPVSFVDYFNDKDLVVFDEPVRLAEKGDTSIDEFRESVIGRLETGYILPSQADVAFDRKKVFAFAESKNLLVISTLDYGFAGIRIKEQININVKSIDNYTSGIETLISDVTKYRSKKYQTVILTGSASKANRLAEELNEQGIPAVFSEDSERPILQGEVVVTSGSLHKGFEYPAARAVVLMCGDGNATVRKKRKNKFLSGGSAIHSLHELVYGDYVVHERNGLGIYRGIEKRENDKKAQDYLKIEYADGELYIPATGLESIQKYASGDADKKPKVNKLNSPEWRKTKARVERAVTDIAKRLVELYAARSMENGFIYGPDTEWQREFEELFPFEETEDQLKAIEDTKRDMESNKIMDRLICGDVGFGKTEIALRAAFKAVQDNKQVAVLVPTTVLAQQHYNTFSARTAPYKLGVDMLSRFRTPAQQRDTLARLKDGRCDIIIGTHRLLSQDVKFKDLGLLIIDEEQRFGVTHKEKIKELRKNIDVLTLTATPIPRTLHMSLSGIREMSVLTEAPVDRLPIQTFVMEHSDEMIREAINREMARGGQVFYVYNRVAGLEDRAALIQKLVPEANVASAHGQMSERQLERIMYDFISGEIDVLVCTTIIETGLDISNVNTMIIDDADKMGLAQLYQLRGRVGRSSRTAYAFLMYRRGAVLKEVAEKRLQAIREFTDLGSGAKIAMRDLEIRGAGNVLGAEQSGHMEEVGYDLYCKMLDTAIKREKGESVPLNEFDTTIKMSVDAFIPPTYIKNETEKLNMYKRIAMIETEDERMDMTDELVDRFGEPPETVMNLLSVAQIKAMCHALYVTLLVQKEEGVRLTFFNDPPMKLELLDAFLTAHSPYLKITTGENTCLTYVFPKTKGNKKRTDKEMFELVKQLLTDMKELY